MYCQILQNYETLSTTSYVHKATCILSLMSSIVTILTGYILNEYILSGPPANITINHRCGDNGFLSHYYFLEKTVNQRLFRPF